MRIAYVANYQGPTLVERRPCMGNFSLAARVKIQILAELLTAAGHDVEIIAQGQLEPQRARDRYWIRSYPSFEEPVRFNDKVPVYYASAISTRYLTGFWEGFQVQALMTERNRQQRFDTVIIYNLQRAQVAATMLARRWSVPVILQYEDDAFVDVHGRPATGLSARFNQSQFRRVLRSLAGGTGVTPYLLAQMPAHVPKLLLRGVVSREIVRRLASGGGPRENWVVFSGTHEGTQGLEQMIRAWRSLDVAGWELHVAGHGPLTSRLRELAAGDRRIVFHGLLDRSANAALLCKARIGLNPQDLTSTPGNVFAFKIVEYLAAGLHVVTTPRGELETDLEQGISYIDTNSPEAIAAKLRYLMETGDYHRNASRAAIDTYGPDAISNSLTWLLDKAAEPS